MLMSQPQQQTKEKPMKTDYPNTIAWFEVPVTDITRAMTFFENVFDTKLETMEMDDVKMAVFNSNGGPNVVHGALVQGPEYTPSKTGTMIYFHGGDDLNTCLSRVNAAGGKVVKEKFPIGEHGHCAMFMDTEGNMLAMHSMN